MMGTAMVVMKIMLVMMVSLLVKARRLQPGIDNPPPLPPSLMMIIGPP